MNAPKISITARPNGFWLYDETRSMNLSMRASSKEAALLEALAYYQEHLLAVEKAHDALRVRVAAFVGEAATLMEEYP